MPKWSIATIATALPLLVNAGLQVSGIRSVELAITLLCLAGICAIFLILTLPPVARRIKLPLLRSLVSENKLDLIIPRLQLTPFYILDDDHATTAMKMYILNYSDYIAKNISVDVKFGDSPLKKELLKAAGLESHKKFFGPGQEKLERLKKFLESPLLDELKPGEKCEIVMIDENKDWILKQKLFFESGNESRTFFKIPIKSKESLFYQASQGWKEQIENTKSGQPIPILFCVEWENEIGKTSKQKVEYQLICTQIGSTRSYKFLPTGNVIGDQ